MAPAARRNIMQNLGTFGFFVGRSFDRLDLTPNAPDAI
jgi:F420-0:gamma-glutamyl ligase-like protein